MKETQKSDGVLDLAVNCLLEENHFSPNLPVNVARKFALSAAEFITGAFFHLVTVSWTYNSKNGLKIRKYVFAPCVRLT